MENISQKINAKLDGINGVVDIKSAFQCSSKDDLFMFFGADVCLRIDRSNVDEIRFV